MGALGASAAQPAAGRSLFSCSTSSPKWPPKPTPPACASNTAGAKGYTK